MPPIIKTIFHDYDDTVDSSTLFAIQQKLIYGRNINALYILLSKHISVIKMIGIRQGYSHISALLPSSEDVAITNMAIHYINVKNYKTSAIIRKIYSLQKHL